MRPRCYWRAVRGRPILALCDGLTPLCAGSAEASHTALGPRLARRPPLKGEPAIPLPPSPAPTTARYPCTRAPGPHRPRNPPLAASPPPAPAPPPRLPPRPPPPPPPPPP